MAREVPTRTGHGLGPECPPRREPVARTVPVWAAILAVAALPAAAPAGAPAGSVTADPATTLAQAPAGTDTDAAAERRPAGRRQGDPDSARQAPRRAGAPVPDEGTAAQPDADTAAGPENRAADADEGRAPRPADAGAAQPEDAAVAGPADPLLALGQGLPAQRLNVGILADAPPLSYMSRHGYRTGFDFAVARALCARLGLECVFEPLAPEDVVPALEARRIDFAVASLSITVELDRAVDFTRPYYVGAARFVAPKAASDGPGGETEHARVLGAVAGSPHAAYLGKHHAGSRLRLYPNEEEMWIDLALGRLDAVLARAVTAKQRFLSQPIGAGFAFSGAPVSDPDVFGPGEGIAVRGGDTRLKAALDAALDDLLASRDYREIRDRHLDADFVVSADRVNPD